MKKYCRQRADNAAGKQLLTLLVLISILAACNKTDDKQQELLRGTWINTHMNDDIVETNNKFVMEYDNETEYYSAGVVIDTVNKKWIDRKSYDFSLEGDRIIISGADVKENKTDLEFGIVSITGSELICRVNMFKINGVEQSDSKIYKFKKATGKYNEEITGTWYGKATYAGSADTDYHYWNYLPGGTYEYYYRDDPGSARWIKKTDNAGRYYLYDDFLATTWTNDIFSGVPGLDFECWEIEIAGDVMKWTGYRSNDKVATYEMKKVTGPPTLF